MGRENATITVRVFFKISWKPSWYRVIARENAEENEVVAGAVLGCAIDFHILQVPRLT